jgi:hypothetical protein
MTVRAVITTDRDRVAGTSAACITAGKPSSNNRLEGYRDSGFPFAQPAS